MSFLNPMMLWGLLAIAIPVIIHLFNFRRHKKVYFTNVRYIQELKLQTRRQSRLRHIMVLVSRILGISFLVLAFSQPYVPVSESAVSPQNINIVSIYLDNSFSMEAEATNGTLLDVAKEKAREIAAGYRASDLFQLLTNDFEGRHQRLISQEEFLELLDEVAPSPELQPLSSVTRRQDESLKSSNPGKRTRFLISDFQKSTADIDNLEKDSLVNSFLVPVPPENARNIFIDSCWFESPVHQIGQGVSLIARIRNESAEDFEKLPVKLTINDLQRAIASFDIGAGSSTLVELPFTNQEAGTQYGTLEITDFPVTFDDRFFLAYDVQQAIPVLTIYGDAPPVYLNSLLGNDSAFAYKSISYKNINYDGFPSFFLIILDGLPEISSGLGKSLDDYVRKGGSLLVIPAPETDLVGYRDFLSGLGVSHFMEPVKAAVAVSDLDLGHPVFKDVFEGDKLREKNDDSPVDLPAVYEYFPLATPKGSFRISLMRLFNQADFLSLEQSGKGDMYLLATPLDDRFTNFQRHALFVPVIYRIALLSGASRPLFYTMGQNEAISLDNFDLEGENVIKLQDMIGESEFIPGQNSFGRTVNLMLYDRIRKAGHYQVKSGDRTLKGIAFNYDRRESVIAYYLPDELEDMLADRQLNGFRVLKDSIKPLDQSIQELNQGKRLWKLFIIFALLFLALEVLFLRIWAVK